MSLPLNSKVWIYASKRPITTNEQEKLTLVFQDFISDWESHGKKLNGKIEIVDDFFVVVAAEDDGNMCGRAQDAQVRLMKAIDEEFNLGLMDRMKLNYQKNAGEIECLSMEEARLKKLEDDTVIFDTMVNSLSAFQESFKKTLKDSWYKRVI